MATISDIQPPPKAPSFSAKLDRSNPLEFVEKALAFLARESDFFQREGGEGGRVGRAHPEGAGEEESGEEEEGGCRSSKINGNGRL
ncbi:hypothetical protein EV2_024088 [Malus domestica]